LSFSILHVLRGRDGHVWLSFRSRRASIDGVCVDAYRWRWRWKIRRKRYRTLVRPGVPTVARASITQVNTSPPSTEPSPSRRECHRRLRRLARLLSPSCLLLICFWCHTGLLNNEQVSMDLPAMDPTPSTQYVRRSRPFEKYSAPRQSTCRNPLIPDRVLEFSNSHSCSYSWRESLAEFFCHPSRLRSNWIPLRPESPIVRAEQRHVNDHSVQWSTLSPPALSLSLTAPQSLRLSSPLEEMDPVDHFLHLKELGFDDPHVSFFNRALVVESNPTPRISLLEAHQIVDEINDLLNRGTPLYRVLPRSPLFAAASTPASQAPLPTSRALTPIHSLGTRHCLHSCLSPNPLASTTRIVMWVGAPPCRCFSALSSSSPLFKLPSLLRKS